MKKAILLLLCMVLLVSSLSFAKPNLPNVPSDSIPYVIITTSEAKSAYQILADWKTKKGTPALVQTMDTILTTQTGIDNTAKVRNYIKAMHDSVNTMWILLGGDVSEVPTRYVWQLSRYLATDYYYSCLNGDWNYDGDTLWGELEDSVDLNPQVYVGRIPTCNPDTVSYFIDKLLSYEKDSPYLDYQTKVLFLSSIIYYNDDAQPLCESLSTYLPPSFTKVYLNEYSSGEGMDSLNSGFGLIVNYSMSESENNFITTWSPRDWVFNSDLDSLNNQHRYGVMLNSTCLNNKFDEDCISKHFILNPSGGLVGYIGTSGYDVPYFTQEFHRSIYDQIFNQGETRIGKVLTNVKLPYIEPASQRYNAVRSEVLTYLLLGDPQMDVWTDTPKHFDLTSPPDTQLECGQTLVGAIAESSNVRIEGVLVCLVKDDEVYEVGYTNSQGIIYFYEDLLTGTASLVGSKHNLLPESLTIVIEPLPQPTSLSATGIHKQINLSWDDNSQSENGFKIERKTTESWYQIATVGVNSESYIDDSIECEIIYYYRVRSYNSTCNSNYSNTAYDTSYTCPDPGCPFLYVWNGNVFVNDNVILTGSEDEYSDKSSLTDYYVLSQSLASKDGKYEFEIREFENEVSQIDNISLFAIDYPLGENVGVTPEGKLWIYTDPVSPISCVDQDGINHLDEILTKDGEYFKCSKPGYLIVNFGRMKTPAFLKPSDQMSDGGGGGTWPPPKDPGIERLVPKSGLNTNIVYIDVIGENGGWKNVSKIYSRTRPVLSLVELSQYVNPNEDFKMKISWDQAYSADHIAYYSFDDADLTITELEFTSATHSDQGDINTLLNTSDNQRVELSPDQSIKLSYTTLPEDSTKQRSFLFVAKGYYEKLETPSDQIPDMAKTLIPKMDQNYPNPFNLSTEIRFTLPDDAKVTLNIYNILGQKVKTIVDEEKSSGTHTIFWDGTDKNGAEVASGIYFYQLNAGDYKELKKMLLIK